MRRSVSVTIVRSKLIGDSMAARSPQRQDVPPETELSRTSTSLLLAAKADDAEAWRRLVDTHQSRIYRWCRRAGLDEADAADVAQEVFIAVARKLADFRRDRPGDSFRKWLRAITTNKLQDYWRARGGAELSRGGTGWLLWLHDMAEHDDPDSSGGGPQLAPDDRRLVAIQRVRAEVKERDWTIFERTAVDEQPATDVAAELGVSVNVVYLAKSRILRRVRACFAEDGADKP